MLLGHLLNRRSIKIKLTIRLFTDSVLHCASMKEILTFVQFVVPMSSIHYGNSFFYSIYSSFFCTGFKRPTRIINYF
jgi:hypothetical protein